MSSSKKKAMFISTHCLCSVTWVWCKWFFSTEVKFSKVHNSVLTEGTKRPYLHVFHWQFSYLVFVADLKWVVIEYICQISTQYSENVQSTLRCLKIFKGSKIADTCLLLLICCCCFAFLWCLTETLAFQKSFKNLGTDYHNAILPSLKINEVNQIHQVLT